MKNKILFIIISVCICVLTMYSISYSIDRTIQVECYKHIKYNKELQDYYINSNQKSLCESMGVDVSNITVKDR